MTNYNNSPIILSPAQIQKIKDLGSADNGKTPNYPAMYAYISDEYKAGRLVGMESSQAYWFEQASKINVSNMTSAASIYIRSVTASGLGAY